MTSGVVFGDAFAQTTVIDLDSTNWNDKIWPTRVTVDDSGNVYIVAIQYPNPSNPSAPYNDPLVKIQKYSSSGNLIFTLPNTWDHFFGTGPKESPGDLAVDNSQNIYVIIRSNPSDIVQKYDSSGLNPQTFATLDFHPFSIVIDNSDKIYVSGYDEINDEGVVSIFDSSGTNLQKLTTHNGIVQLGVDNSGNSWLFDNTTLEKFDSSGNLLFTKTVANENKLSQYGGLVVNSDGELFVPNNDNSEVNIFDSSGNFINSFGSPGTGVGEFAEWNASGGLHVSGPLDVDIGSDDKIYVAGYGGHRIQIFPADYLDNTSSDSTSPSVTTSIDLAVFATGSTTVSYATPTATDNIGVTSGPTCNYPSGSSFSQGTTTVTCTATDAAGNVGTSSFQIKVGSDVLSSSNISFVESIGGASNWGYPDYCGSWGCTKFQFPSGISYNDPENVDSLGNSYDVLNSNNVGSSNNFVQKSSSSGSLIFQLGSAGIGSEIGFFYNPEDVVVDSHDNFYVADRSNSRVQVFDSDGFYLFSLTSGTSQFSGDLYNLAIDDLDNLYVADNLNEKIIHVFSNSFGTPQDGSFVLPCSMQEAGDGVSAGSCHGFYSNGIARAEVGITYHSGLFPIEDYTATGYFIDDNGVQGSNISVTHNLIQPNTSATLVFENSQTGLVSEFKMQMLGGELVIDEPEPVSELNSQTFSVAVNGVSYSVDIRTENATVSTMTPDVNFKSIILSVDVIQNTGILEIDLDREFFDSTFQGLDDEFSVLVNGDQPSFTEIFTSSQSRTLSIELPAGAEELEIIGSKFAEGEPPSNSNQNNWNIGDVLWLESNYFVDDVGIVRIMDSDMNSNPESIDKFTVDVWSDSDAYGLSITVTETSNTSGIFEGIVLFTTTGESYGNQLKVLGGDLVSIEYEDNTLPAPYSADDVLSITTASLINSKINDPLDISVHLFIDNLFLQGDIMMVNGVVKNFDGNENVHIKISDPEGHIATQLTISPFADGTFETPVSLHGPSYDANGTYFIKAVYGEYHIELPFTIQEYDYDYSGIFNMNEVKNIINSFDFVYTTYSNKENNFSIEYPSPWIIDENYASGHGNIGLVSFVPEPMETAWLSVWGTVDGVTSVGNTLLNQMKDRMEQEYEQECRATSNFSCEFNFIDAEIVEINGYTHHILEYMVVYNNPDAVFPIVHTMVQSYVPAEGKIWEINASVNYSLIALSTTLLVPDMSNDEIIEISDVISNKLFSGLLESVYSFELISPFSEPKLSFVKTNNVAYDEGDLISFSGKVSDFSGVGVVTIKLESSNDQILFVDQIYIDSQGAFSSRINPPNSMTQFPGTYSIVATLNDQQKKTSFKYGSTETSYDNTRVRITEPEPSYLGIASFVDKTKDPQWYIDRYNNEVTYKKWFDENYPEYDSIYQAVGMEEFSTPEPTIESKSEALITTANGSGSPGCEETSDGCFLPEVTSVSFGGKVIMKNTDSAAHTFTSGTPGDGPTGEFDTGLLMAGGSYEWTANEDGQVPYFCMVHPWMIGTIFVGDGTVPTPQPEPEDHIDLEISAENKVYDINTVAVLNIFLEGNTKSQNVAIDIADPKGTTIVSRSVSIDPDDSISFEFKIDENAKTGNYKVTATTSDGNRTEKDTTHFKVKSQFNSFKISSIEITDQKGNPSDLESGEIGFIKVNMDSNKSIATLVTVNIFDSELTSIGIGSVQTTLSSGESEMILSFNIPSDAALGPADIYVNAFSDWPSEGGIPLTGEVSAVEDIQ